MGSKRFTFNVFSATHGNNESTIIAACQHACDSSDDNLFHGLADVIGSEPVSEYEVTVNVKEIRILTDKAND